MDGFPTLPLEISRLILVEAVRLRGIKRAARLRFVSQSWNREITEAIFESGMLDGLGLLHLSPFWPKYLTYKIMRRDKPLSRALCIIRRVAERVLAFRGQGNSNVDALRQYVLEICQLSPHCNRCGPGYQSWFEVPEQMEAGRKSIDDSEEFKEALLAAAAYTNDIALVRQLLPAMQEYPYLISQDGGYEHW